VISFGVFGIEPNAEKKPILNPLDSISWRESAGKRITLTHNTRLAILLLPFGGVLRLHKMSAKVFFGVRLFEEPRETSALL
jgi:hypothetical protein